MRLVRSWDRFWFSPSDPTVLGLIRICCGFIVLYVHIAYTYDLQSFFGKHAWLDLQARNEFRYNIPVVAPPPNWEDPPRLDVDPDEQPYLDKWGVHPRLPGVVRG